MKINQNCDHRQFCFFSSVHDERCGINGMYVATLVYSFAAGVFSKALKTQA
jgi:hypothetical protein